MTNLQLKLKYLMQTAIRNGDSGEVIEVELAMSEFNQLKQENKKLKVALETISNWQGSNKGQVEHCINVLKGLSDD